MAKKKSKMMPFKKGYHYIKFTELSRGDQKKVLLSRGKFLLAERIMLILPPMTDKGGRAKEIEEIWIWLHGLSSETKKYNILCDIYGGRVGRTTFRDYVRNYDMKALCANLPPNLSDEDFEDPTIPAPPILLPLDTLREIKDDLSIAVSVGLGDTKTKKGKIVDIAPADHYAIMNKYFRKLGYPVESIEEEAPRVEVGHLGVVFSAHEKTMALKWIFKYWATGRYHIEALCNQCNLAAVTILNWKETDPIVRELYLQAERQRTEARQLFIEEAMSLALIELFENTDVTEEKILQMAVIAEGGIEGEEVETWMNKVRTITKRKSKLTAQDFALAMQISKSMGARVHEFKPTGIEISEDTTLDELDQRRIELEKQLAEEQAKSELKPEDDNTEE